MRFCFIVPDSALSVNIQIAKHLSVNVILNAGRLIFILKSKGSGGNIISVFYINFIKCGGKKKCLRN
jgi:hypothetical protein